MRIAHKNILHLFEYLFVVKFSMHGQNKLYILINVHKLTSKIEHDFKFKFQYQL